MGVLLASIFLPKFFRGFSGTPGYKQVAETLAQQFMPHKNGRGFQDEILLAEITMLLSPDAKKKFVEILLKLSKGEKQFLSGSIALFAAKYQKEKKQTQKSPDGKDVAQTIASLEPLTTENPAIKFLEQILVGEERSVAETIELLRSKNMIHESFAGKVRVKYEKYKLDHGDSTDQVITELLGWIEKSAVMPKQKVGPLGLYFAFLMGRSDKVELAGKTSVKKLIERIKSWKQS